MRKLVVLCTVVIIGLFSFLNDSKADGTVTVNGVGLTIFEKNGVSGIQALRFNSYTLGTSGTYVYNDSGGTGATAGSLSVVGYDRQAMALNVTNTDNGTVTIRLEYKVGASSFWVNYLTATVSGTGTYYISNIDPVTFIRWGLIKSGTSSAIVTMEEEYTRSLNE